MNETLMTTLNLLSFNRKALFLGMHYELNKCWTVLQQTKN